LFGLREAPIFYSCDLLLALTPHKSETLLNLLLAVPDTFFYFVTAMKFYNNLLALCVFHPTVWGTTAFVVKTPNAVNSQTKLYSSSTYNYLNSDNLKTASVGAEELSQSETGGPLGKVAGSADEVSPAESMKDIWTTSAPIKVQGGSLRTWSFSDPSVERVQVLLKTEGRPLNANVELWHGPDNTPQKMAVYLEDGSLRPFNAVVETPNGQNAVAIRNTGQMEFPLSACVFEVVSDGTPLGADATGLKTVQGGAIFTTPFGASVSSVRVVLKTDGRPLSARIELLQGPSNNKQVMEIYSEDGLRRPFHCVIDTPGSGNVVRIVNAATMEYPLSASVEPYSGGTYTGGSTSASTDGDIMSFGTSASKFLLNPQM
jgi:hypothetical protein